jgi:hypothetical protein
VPVGTCGGSGTSAFSTTPGGEQRTSTGPGSQVMCTVATHERCVVMPRNIGSSGRLHLLDVCAICVVHELLQKSSHQLHCMLRHTKSEADHERCMYAVRHIVGPFEVSICLLSGVCIRPSWRHLYLVQQWQCRRRLWTPRYMHPLLWH